MSANPAGVDVLRARWPYPRWIAHRGAGLLAPENTLAAFRHGLAQAYRMFECDVRLSKDGQLFLLHDDRLERTTSGTGVAADCPWPALARLDAGSWHSATHTGEPLLQLDELLAFCQQAGCALNIELKASPGQEERTGRAVAASVVRQWTTQPWPLLSSFSVAALAAAAAQAPQLPRALLAERCSATALAAALELGCVAMVLEAGALTEAEVATVHAAGLAVLCYTVNEREVAARLLDWAVEGIITDRVDVFDPAVAACCGGRR